MKNLFSLSAIAVLMLTNSSQAIERLTPIKEPKERPVEKQSKPVSERAWLGVAGQPVTTALAAQLGIDHGVTLELVAPDGSAGKAGIKKFDVLTDIGGVPIKNMQDLRTIMAKSAINETLEVEVFSEGQMKKHKVVLDAHPGNFSKGHVKKRPLAPRPLSNSKKSLPQAFQLPPEMNHDRIEKIMEAQIKQMEQHFAEMSVDPADLQALKDKSLKMNLGGISGNMQSSFSSSVTVMDEHGSIHVKNSGDAGKYVEVKDKGGETLYSGPYQTDEDKAKVPDEVRARIDALGLESKGGGLDFSFGR